MQLSGLRAWTIQRVSAIYIALFVIVALIAVLLGGMPDSHAAWKALLASPFINLALMAFFVALLLHAWVGARDVIVDYVHPLTARFTVLALAAIFLIVCGLWAARVLLGVW
ncbi:MAG: succinate dehydrogenase, hydrophobic membrane anchor protein [Gammaproteobacteria bacterium]|jgi:succinate dehydrogenase / fumarate reductase, membrane anchor subunit